MTDYTLSWWENEDGAWKQRSATVSADSQSEAIVLLRDKTGVPLDDWDYLISEMMVRFREEAP